MYSNLVFIGMKKMFHTGLKNNYFDETVIYKQPNNGSNLCTAIYFLAWKHFFKKQMFKLFKN